MVLSFATGAWADEVNFTFGFSQWDGVEASFSGSAKDEVTQTREGVVCTYTRNGSSLYANTSSLRLYKSNTLKFEAPNGYNITSIVFTCSSYQTDITSDTGTCTATSSSLSWVGESSSITFTRPSTASSYATISGATVTITASGEQTKTLTSISISGTPTRTSYYDGDTFDTKGLVVTGKYSDNSTAEITSGVTWAVTPKTLSVGTTSVSVVATVNGISSEAYTVNGLVVSAISDKTIADFIASEGGKCYLTGTVSNIVNTMYGNFDLTDESGKIYVYGCLTPAGEAKKFESLGIVVGDKIKVLANEYKLYNETEEAVNVVFVEKIESETPTKQTPTITATYKTSLEVGKNDVYEVEYDGDGALSVGSSKTAVATATILGKTITVTPVAAGTTTITISAPETEKYYAAEKKYTLNVTAPVVPAELPFLFDGGRADIATTNGMSQSGLGTDYSSSPKLKFDNTNDEVVINFNGQAKELKYTIKGNGFTGNAFDVLESADGNEYTTIKRYTSLSTTENESFVLKAESRYVKFIYTDKNAGNVALGKIQITKGGTLSDPEFAFENTSYTFFTTNEEMKVKAESKKGSAGKITYALTEGDEDAFAIDENTGDIVCETAGLYKVTATIAETSEYYSATATCTVKIIEPIVTNSIIVAGTPKGHFAMKTTMGDGKYFESIQVYKAGDKYVTIGNLDDILFATNETEGKVTIQNAEGLYVQATGAKAVGYTENAYEWSVNEEGVLTAANTAYGTLQYNTSSPRFTTYASKTGQYATISTSYAEGYVRDITLAEGQEVKYGTICLDRTIEAADLTGATFYSIAGKKVNANNVVTSIVLEEETGGLVAGCPYIFAATANVVAAYTGDVEATAAEANNGLVGSLEGTGVAEGMYLITNNTVKKCGAGCKIGANRAYINMDDVPEYTATVGAKVIELTIEGETTSISEINVCENLDGAIYNLAGQRVNASAKGMLIKNGKKYLVK